MLARLVPLVFVTVFVALASACVEPAVGPRPCDVAADCEAGFACVARVCVAEEPDPPEPDPDPDPVTQPCPPERTLSGGDLQLCGAPTVFAGDSASDDGRFSLRPAPRADVVQGVVSGGAFELR